jgi:hypothetical protein
MPKVVKCTNARHGNLPCGKDGNPIGVQAEDHHWHISDETGTAYHAACKPLTRDSESSQGGLPRSK